MCIADYAPVIQEMVLSHASLTKDLEDGINGPSALKHLRQQVYKIYRIYPWPAGDMTRYIPRERSVLE